MYKETFAIRLKEARTEYGISQQTLANEISIDKSAISKYEAGKIQPNLETIGKIAEYLNVSSDWLLGSGSVPSYTGITPFSKIWSSFDLSLC